MAQNLYNPRVLLGNWNEDLFLEEDLMKDFLEKRDKGQLLIQRSRRLKETLLRPTKLSVSADGFIHFGDQVLLVNPSYEEKEADLFLGGDLSLCMSPDEIQAYLAHGLEVPCGLSAAQTRAPLGRNTFCVLSSSCPVTIGRCNGQLHAHGCRLCPWRHSRPSLVGGRPPGPTPTCGWSMRAPRCRTYFGKEAEVAAHTHLDTHKVEKPRNHWLLVTGNPRDAGSTMLDVPPPPAQVPETE
ncbi:cilia- and flagella-associated protein 161-like isoform X5 [Sorex fumeus]|uniref:cilia- and flagella-associated protein 161-like isoform X5 n=1 Tax=Sorex fumeus TaxID=62283 RepID=UPI0024AE691D|nr:cilia- and flagella-associated protein 161-like isoform X5 [Sorex fumeus]